MCNFFDLSGGEPETFCFGFTSPDDRLPIGKSGYSFILNNPTPHHQASPEVK